MADAIRRTLRKVRHKFKPPKKPEHPLVKVIAQIKAKQYKQEFWERDKAIVRDANFKKALQALAVARQAEQARQAEITKQRLKNLKKARKQKEKNRSTDHDTQEKEG